MNSGGDPPEDYYTHARPEVMALVPRSCRTIVDVGCGGGGLGRGLKAREPGVQVRGVELMPKAAEQARAYLDDVVQATAERPMPAHWPRPDCLIFADVLEHLVDPWAVLAAWAATLKSGGTVVLSLPNVGHHSVLNDLVAGRWDYVEAGVLDRTHLRFFTRASAIALARDAGLEVLEVRRVIDAPFRGIRRNLIRQWGKSKARREPLSGHAPGLRRFMLNYCTYQFLLRCAKKVDA